MDQGERHFETDHSLESIHLPVNQLIYDVFWMTLLTFLHLQPQMMPLWHLPLTPFPCPTPHLPAYPPCQKTPSTTIKPGTNKHDAGTTNPLTLEAALTLLRYLILFSPFYSANTYKLISNPISWPSPPPVRRLAREKKAPVWLCSKIDQKSQPSIIWRHWNLLMIHTHLFSGVNHWFHLHIEYQLIKFLQHDQIGLSLISSR